MISILLMNLAAAALLGAEEPAPDIAQKLGDELVTVQFVLKTDVAGDDNNEDSETQTECYGLLIDPNGLIVCPNSKLGGTSAAVSQMLAAMGQNVTATPRDIKVVVGPDGDEVDAEIIARDGELDLAWLRMKQAPPAGTPTADLSKPDAGRLGQQVVALARAGRYLGRPALAVRTQIGGRTVKPRPLLLCTYRFNEPGVPLLDAEGRLVGMTVLQVPEIDVGGDTNVAMGRLMSEMQATGMVVLPAETIAKATVKALEEAKNKPASAPAPAKRDD